MPAFTRRTAALALLAAAAARAAPVAPETKIADRPEASPVWAKVRASLVGTREVLPAPAGLLTLDAPARAVDGAVVPVAVRVGALRAGQHVQRLLLVIDSNPSPISAIVTFGPASPRPDLETRVRVDDYSHVRAIAEMSDGTLVMTTRFVKAAGGCSAPAGADAEAALATLGRMTLGVIGEARRGQPALAQLTVSHPNHSGLALDQVSRLFVPAHFVRQVQVSWGERLVFNADVDFSISENPSLRFWFLPDGVGELVAEVSDTQARQWKRRFAVALAD